jgi:hypothetical protein
MRWMLIVLSSWKSGADLRADFPKVEPRKTWHREPRGGAGRLFVDWSGGGKMSREVRGMLMGLCIVILAAAAYFQKEKPMNTPGGAGTTTQRTVP